MYHVIVLTNVQDCASLGFRNVVLSRTISFGFTLSKLALCALSYFLNENLMNVHG